MTDSSDRILRIKSVLEKTGLSRATLYRKLTAGTFPAQIKIAERCVGWRLSEVDHWIDQSGSGSATMADVHRYLEKARANGG